MKPIYKRIILKISGEALADQENHAIYDKAKLVAVATAIKEVYETGVQIGIVVGAGNVWRGKLAASVGIEQSTGDYMGMLGTIMNGLAIQSALEEKGIPTRVASAINVPQVCEPYIRRKAIHHMENGRKMARVSTSCWYTNLPVQKHTEDLVLYKHYSPEEYPKYDNYDAIEVKTYTDIPCDYDGVIGVPITFLDKLNPEQFEVLGVGSGDMAKEIGINKNYRGRTDLAYTIDGVHKCPFGRILIKKKECNK